MDFAMWDGLFNAFLLLLWFRLWARQSRDLVFNPYLAPMDRAADRIVDFLRPVFAGLHGRWIAGLTFVFALAFRGVAVPANGLWTVSLGMVRRADTEQVMPCILFSVISFGAFLFKLWCLSLIYARVRSRFSDRAGVALHNVSRPFTDFPVELRPFILLAFGIGLSSSLALVGLTAPAIPFQLPIAIDWSLDSPAVTALKLLFATLGGGIDVLATLRSIMIFLIIGSWVAMFAGSPGVSAFCQDWIGFLLGPMRAWPIRVGTIDFSPIVFFLLLGAAHSALVWALMRAVASLP